MSINFNTAPYFDDYDESKKFQKILFRPGKAVQTRELNQLQSLYQKQLDRFGQGIYKEGAMVIPGGISLNKTIGYVKLSGQLLYGNVAEETPTGGDESVLVFSQVDYNPDTQDIDPVPVSEYQSVLTGLIDKRITDLSTGLSGIVKYFQLQTDTTPLTLFVEYDTSKTAEEGDSVSVQEFTNSSTLVIKSKDEDPDNNYEAYQVTTASTDATGTGSLAEIERGVYFVKGYFTLVEKQTIVLDAYSNNPTYRVGLKIVETVVTPEEDSSLYDNACGSGCSSV